MLSRSFALALLLACSSNMYAHAPLKYDPDAVAQKSSHPAIGQIDFSMFLIEKIGVLKSVLKDVAALDPKARMSKLDNQNSFICLRGKDDVTLLFMTSAFVPNENVIGSIELMSPEMPRLKMPSCMKSSFVSAKLGFSSGIKLGLERDSVERILGKPTYRSNELIEYSYEKDIDVSRGIVLSSGVDFYFSRGKVVRIIVYGSQGS